MATARKYELSPKRVDAAARAKLRRLVQKSRKHGDARTLERAQAVLGYVEGRPAATIAAEMHLDRSTVFRWIAAYATLGLPALRPAKPPGATPRLTEAQLDELAAVIEAGPEAAGFSSAVWTARMINEYIRREFRVEYNWKYVPELLHRLGFSVQRPRKKLARADRDAQARWLRSTFPAIKKKRPDAAAS